MTGFQSKLEEGIEARKKGRPEWPSRTSFLLAAIGSAVGLGNIWRFPFLTYKHGGGVFLIPYLLCLVVIGFPVLLLELSLGLKFRAGDVEAFGGIHRRLRGIGISSVVAGFVIVSYYANIIAWSCVYLVSSFISPLPWTAMAQGVSQTCDLSQALSSEENFLYNAVLHLGDAKQLQAASSSIMSGWVYGGLVFIFIITYFCIWKGVRSAGRVVYFTATAPVVVLIILFGYNISLKGAGDGVKAYIGTWDFSSLDSPDIWTDAAGQIFFTLSVSMGIMTAYGSYVNPKSDLVMVVRPGLAPKNLGEETADLSSCLLRTTQSSQGPIRSSPSLLDLWSTPCSATSCMNLQPSVTFSSTRRYDFKLCKKSTALRASLWRSLHIHGWALCTDH
mmetsp:Transcript_17497/g.41867  ORF Transcript_17497/g.41867 Transcript_17497/m.41867 type:complete len:389 (+) Transcript_17497:92-1258(+)